MSTSEESSVPARRLTAPHIAILAVITLIALVAGVIAVAALRTADRATTVATRTSLQEPAVGAWLVHATNARFAWQVFTFHADGTMGQTIPDAGDRGSSDSGGIWRRDGCAIIGKFVEVTANRDTGAFATRGEISFRFTVRGDQLLAGSADADFYDVDGKHQRGPLTTPLTGVRVHIGSGATR